MASVNCLKNKIKMSTPYILILININNLLGYFILLLLVSALNYQYFDALLLVMQIAKMLYPLKVIFFTQVKSALKTKQKIVYEYF